jgi:hypothetical protein
MPAKNLVPGVFLVVWDLWLLLIAFSEILTLRRDSVKKNLTTKENERPRSKQS